MTVARSIVIRPLGKPGAMRPRYEVELREVRAGVEVRRVKVVRPRPAVVELKRSHPDQCPRCGTWTKPGQIHSPQCGIRDLWSSVECTGRWNIFVEERLVEDPTSLFRPWPKITIPDRAQGWDAAGCRECRVYRQALDAAMAAWRGRFCREREFGDSASFGHNQKKAPCQAFGKSWAFSPIPDERHPLKDARGRVELLREDYIEHWRGCAHTAHPTRPGGVEGLSAHYGHEPAMLPEPLPCKATLDGDNGCECVDCAPRRRSHAKTPWIAKRGTWRNRKWTDEMEALFAAHWRQDETRDQLRGVVRCTVDHSTPAVQTRTPVAVVSLDGAIYEERLMKSGEVRLVKVRAPYFDTSGKDQHPPAALRRGRPVTLPPGETPLPVAPDQALATLDRSAAISTGSLDVDAYPAGTTFYFGANELGVRLPAATGLACVEKRVQEVIR